MSKATERALDKIYGGPPADFIKARNELAKQLRADGDAEAASAVKALRRPSKAAALVNALVLAEGERVRRYLGLADKLRKATSGKVDAAQMRELAREEGELLEELVGRAGELADAASASSLDRVRETLQAAQVDSELAGEVLSGRVEREQRAASVGLENLAAPPQAARGQSSASKTPTRDPGAAKEKEADRKRASEAKDALKEAKAEARAAARRVAQAERELAKASRARAAADGKVERAEQRLADLG